MKNGPIIFNSGELADSLAQFQDTLARFFDIGTNAGADLDNGFVHLRLDVLLQHNLAFIEHLRNVGAQFARDRIDDLKFFFDADSELFFHDRWIPPDRMTSVSPQYLPSDHCLSELFS